MHYRFSTFELDTERHEFRASGKLLALEPQVFDVLRHLVENHDRMVSRDDLIDAVWDGRIVSDAAVSARINAVRRAVGDSGKTQHFIKTIPRRGFRFVAQVTVDGPKTPDGKADSRAPETSGGIEDVEVGAAAEAAGEASPANEAPALEPPDKPSIAVLPFDNMSGDPEQGYLADGLAEDIITALSKISAMFVIARNCTFAYKGRSPDVRQVGRDLGVRTVLEGSVRRAGNRVRITAQLVDVDTGVNLWAERYDRELADIFDLQDEITEKIVTALQVELAEGEQHIVRRRQTNDLDAWEFMVRGQDHLRRFTPEDNEKARVMFQEALGRDPEFEAAWSLLAWTHLVDARLGYSPSPDASLEQGAALVKRGLAVDPEASSSLAVLGAIRVFQRRFDEAEEAGRKAVAVGPNVADSHVWLATILNYTGRPEESLRLIQKAMRLSPYYPDWYLGILALSYRVLGRFEDSIAADEKRLARQPNNPLSNFRLAAVYAEMGRMGEARQQVSTALAKNPRSSLRQVRASEPYRDEAELERYLDLLRKAGLPE